MSIDENSGEMMEIIRMDHYPIHIYVFLYDLSCTFQTAVTSVCEHTSTDTRAEYFMAVTNFCNN